MEKGTLLPTDVIVKIISYLPDHEVYALWYKWKKLQSYNWIWETKVCPHYMLIEWHRLSLIFSMNNFDRKYLIFEGDEYPSYSIQRVSNKPFIVNDSTIEARVFNLYYGLFKYIGYLFIGYELGICGMRITFTFKDEDNLSRVTLLPENFKSLYNDYIMLCE